MKKSVWIVLLTAVTMTVFAVPAKRGWQTVEQADGTTVELQLIGDEFNHYWVNRAGEEVRLNAAGMYEAVGTAPSRAQVQARRAQVKARKQRAEVGVKPNLAPRGVVILVNFADTKMQSAHTLSVFDELCNSENCTVNAYAGKHYPSAAEYFKAQSDGKYRPQFDVFGPVTLEKGYAFYGQNDEDGNDLYPADAVIEACILAKEQYPNLNFADYDSDKDGYVDFIYVIYAGKGEADGGDENTIWPHNWEIELNVTPYICDYRSCWVDPNGERLSCCYTEEDIVIDGVTLNNYAMSSELSGNALGGIGTLCHEFGHVMGLPDLYDTNYGTNYRSELTPAEWNIMDGGSYNGDGHCPPNYDPWQKYFMGWITPENLGDVGQDLVLEANGTAGYKAYQVNESGKQESATQTGLNYYFENRQQNGWDEYIPAEGMLIWKVDFDANAWTENEPNNTANRPRYTLVIPSGTRIGANRGSQNVWPYADKNTWEGVSGRPLKDITRDGKQIKLTYIDNLTSFLVQWFVNGELLESREYSKDGSEELSLPTTPFDACEDTQFIGWTQQPQWCDPFAAPEDLDENPNGNVTRPANYYAVFE